MWLAPLPGDAALATGLEFYRQELEGRRRLFRNVLRWFLGPVLLAIAAFVFSILRTGAGSWKWSLIPNMAPFLAILVIWIASVIVMRIRGQWELQREIDELSAIESENRLA